MLDRFIKSIIDHHVDTAAAFVGGAGVSLFGLWHIDPAVIVGKIAMTFTLGFIGGVAGITAKWACNKLFPTKRTRHGKN